MQFFISQIPWIVEFIMESGWGCEIVKTLDKVRPGRIDSSTVSALEDMLVCLVKASDVVAEKSKKKNNDRLELVEAGIIGVCQKHKLKDLATAIAKQ